MSATGEVKLTLWEAMESAWAECLKGVMPDYILCSALSARTIRKGCRYGHRFVRLTDQYAVELGIDRLAQNRSFWDNTALYDRRRVRRARRRLREQLS